MGIRTLAFISMVSLAGACSPDKPPVKTGVWRATLLLQGRQLPFNFELVNDREGGYDVFLINAEERLLLDEVVVTGDSIDMSLHVFDANIRAKIQGDSLRGLFIKNPDKGYEVPFRAYHGQNFRFAPPNDDPKTTDFSGKYSVTFINESDSTPAIGIFAQKGSRVTGTFLTPTGDYRYLEGSATGAMMALSTFDGNHAYLFTAVRNDDGTLSGEFLSGKTWKQGWVAHPGDDAAMPDPESMTTMKPGFDRLVFTFPGLDGKPIRLSDEKYREKVVIVQLLGTWCPNCMDETRFLNTWYRDNRDRGVEVLGLAFERKSDFDYASTRVKKMKTKLGVAYDFAIAGSSDKEEASKALPELSEVAAFPTTIFVGRDGAVKKIHTGFSGPGTGVYYDQFIEHFNETVNELLAAPGGDGENNIN